MLVLARVCAPWTLSLLFRTPSHLLSILSRFLALFIHSFSPSLAHTHPHVRFLTTKQGDAGTRKATMVAIWCGKHTEASIQ